MDSQQDLSAQSVQSTVVNLQDLHSYLVTFNKEIGPSDQSAFQVFLLVKMTGNMHFRHICNFDTLE